MERDTYGNILQIAVMYLLSLHSTQFECAFLLLSSETSILGIPIAVILLFL